MRIEITLYDQEHEYTVGMEADQSVAVDEFVALARDAMMDLVNASKPKAELTVACGPYMPTDYSRDPVDFKNRGG